VRRARARKGGIGGVEGMTRVRHAGAFVLKSSSARTLLITLVSGRAVTSAGVKTTSRQGQWPHEVIRRRADDDADEVAV
jgi:hypothetical protein